MKRWATISAIGFAVAAFVSLRTGPYSGGAGSPWEDFLPEWTTPMLVASAGLFGGYLVLLRRRASRGIWVVAVLGSWVPVLLALYPCALQLRHAQENWLYPTEASDVYFWIAVAEDIFFLSLLFSAMLTNISVYGYFRRANVA